MLYLMLKEGLCDPQMSRGIIKGEYETIDFDVQ